MGVVTSVRTSGQFTRADLDAMPDDGRRYELVDGSIVVTPSPGLGHQRVVMRLGVLLYAACPSDLEVLTGPFDVALGEHTVLVPDLLVAPRAAFTKRDLPGPPLLAVEVLSPSTRRRDLGDKLTAYRDAGCPSYWVVDPTAPRLRAFALREGEYVEVADVAGDQTWTSTEPYPVVIRPDGLVR
jgi:Uma2 family endonuclease